MIVCVVLFAAAPPTTSPPPGVPVLVDPTVVSGPTLSMVELGPVVAMLVAGVFIPMLVDLVIASSAPPVFKSGVAAMLSVLAGVISTVVWSPGTSFSVYAVNVAVAFIMSMAAHKAGVSHGIQEALPGGMFDTAPGKHARDE